MNEDLRNLVELNPPWKQAVISFLEAQFDDGTIVPHEWFYKHFRLEQNRPDTPHEKAQQTDLLFLKYFDKLQEALLKDHHIHLHNKFAVGYEIVRPNEQTSRAEKEGIREMSRGLSKMGQRVLHVDLKRLTDRERQENADALARVAQFSGMLKRLRSGNSVKDLPEVAEQ